MEHFHDISNQHTYAFVADYDTQTREQTKLAQFIQQFRPEDADPSIKLTNLLDDFPSSRTKQIKLNTFRIRESFFDDDEDFKAGKKRRYRELQLRIKKRIIELYKGNPHAKIESSIPVLPQMPKNIQSAVGKSRFLFKDINKDKAKNFNKERKDE